MQKKNRELIDSWMEQFSVTEIVFESNEYSFCIKNYGFEKHWMWSKKHIREGNGGIVQQTIEFYCNATTIVNGFN